MGDHLVRGGECHIHAADGLAHAPDRAGAPLHRLDAALRGGFLPLRSGALDRHAGRLPGAAGAGGGTDDPAVAITPARELSEGQGGRRAHRMVDDHTGGAGGRAGARRLDHRQLLLALDLLHQRSDRHRGGPRDLVDLPAPRDSDCAPADRQGGPGPARPLGRRDADPARQGQESRLVQLAAHRRRWPSPR